MPRHEGKTLMSQYSPSELDRIFYGTTTELNILARYTGCPIDARGDECGHIIARSHYGRAESFYGWEVDHRQPSALGGANWPSNLRALSCRRNRSDGGILAALLKG